MKRLSRKGKLHLVGTTMIVYLLACLGLHGQTNDQTFPEGWIGDWTGDLVISTTAGEVQRIPMGLSIQPITDSTYTYSILYGENTPENQRPYLLKTLNASQGLYQVDENNGIVLDEYFIGGKLYSRFEVMGTLLLSTVEKQDSILLYEIIAGSATPSTTTGDTIIAGDTIPPVNSYGIRIQQRARLYRKD